MLDLQKCREIKFKEDRADFALQGENLTMLACLKSGFGF